MTKLILFVALSSFLNVAQCDVRVESSSLPSGYGSKDLGFGKIMLSEDDDGVFAEHFDPHEDGNDKDDEAIEEEGSTTGDVNETAWSTGEPELAEPDTTQDFWSERTEVEGCFCRNESLLHSKHFDVACRCYGESVTAIPTDLAPGMKRL